jgi:pimeloyl-ACP methyl ester carboxylesterase
MPNVAANGIRIEYDTFGAPSSQPLLLIMGFSGQMVGWYEELCNQLAKQGLYVIRFDNRDVGLSSKIDEAGEPNVIEILAAYQRGEEVKPPYTLDDMADDAIGLLDALTIDKAHICGVSMGGMIAQIIAIRYPSRVSSLISMRSSTGDPELPQGKPEVWALLLSPRPAEREANIEHGINFLRALEGSKFPPDEQLVRRIAELAYDRCYHPQGIARQAVASMTAGNRTQALKSVTAPTLVIHGSEDPIFPVEHGKATAEAISGAELLIIEGMGHGFSNPEVWPRLVDAIAAHTHKADT